ncbi:MAG: peptidylprolyl isomerase, partial [Saprospiraceae bacterium]|nr:peptidylprolyl isomerase [Saprospiraceae bacterium]
FFEISELDPDIFFALDTMKVGELSYPIEFTMDSGERAFRLVLLQSRTDPHRANLKQDYTKIKNAAIEERKSEYLNRWLDDKIKSTFVQLDPSFLQACDILQRWAVNLVKQ